MKATMFGFALYVVSSSLPSSVLGADQEPAADTESLVLRPSTHINGYDHAFGHVGAITADGLGRIYVLDTHPASLGVYVFDADGQNVARFGRPGDGPGEFRDLRPSLAWSADTLVVFDGRAGRLTGFDLGGSVAFTRPWPGDLVRLSPHRLLSSDSQLFGVARLAAGRNTMEYLRIPPDGPAVAMPAWREPLPDLAGRPPQILCGTPKGVALEILEPPFLNKARLGAVTPGGELVRASSAAYRVEVVNQSGEVLRTIERDHRSLPLREDDWRRTPEGAWVSFYEQGGGGRMLSATDRTTQCEFYDELPALAPPIQTVTVDEAARIWVEGVNYNTGEGFTVSVFDWRGDLMGRAPMPDRDGRVLPYVRGERLYVVQTDPVGVQSVQVFDVDLP